MFARFIEKLKIQPRDFILFFMASACVGFSQSAVDSTLNNFLNETFAIPDFTRSIIEIPRETPGFLVVFISAALFVLGSRRLAFVANILAAAGIFFIGLFSFNLTTMLVWLFVYSTGQHLFMPVSSGIGMELAEKGKEGKRLGQLNGIMNFTAILGSFVIFLGFRFFHFNFTSSFVLAGAGFFAAAILLLIMKPGKSVPFHERLKLKKKYTLFYWLSILFGTRKQIFLTFAPWVLVTVFHQKIEVLATLYTIGGIIGIGFKPLLGYAIDRFGERALLMLEAFSLIFVCLGYGFSRFLFNDQMALLVTAICFILDNLLMSFSMARATYLKKIAEKPEDISSTLAMGVTIDHVFSITIALTGGILWSAFGYQAVFLMGACIATINLVSAGFVRTAGES